MKTAIAIASAALALSLGACRSRRQPPASQPSAPVLPVTEVNVAEPGAAPRLRGFEPGTPSWLWAQPKVTVRLDRPAVLDAPQYLDLDFAITQELDLEATGARLQVTAFVNGTEICRKDFSRQGRYHLECPVPETALTTPTLEAAFAFNRSFPNHLTGAQLSVPVVAVRIIGEESIEQARTQHLARARDSYSAWIRQWKGVDPETVREMTRLFHKLPVWRSSWFHGVPILKSPLDLWTMQQVIYEVKPDFIIETGTLEGGSALYWAALFERMELHTSKVLTIDIGTGHRAAEANRLWKAHVEFFHSSSTDPALVARLAARVKGKRVLVTLDSDHRMPHVLRELRLYSPLVSQGSYLVVEDTGMDGVPTYPDMEPGPTAAVQKFLADGGSRDFEQDFSREAFLMTFNPGGWLRRK